MFAAGPADGGFVSGFGSGDAVVFSFSRLIINTNWFDFGKHARIKTTTNRKHNTCCSPAVKETTRVTEAEQETGSESPSRRDFKPFFDLFLLLCHCLL